MVYPCEEYPFAFFIQGIIRNIIDGVNYLRGKKD